MLLRVHTLVLLTFCIGFVASCVGPGPRTPMPAYQPAPWPMPTPIRGVWVARFHYHDPDGVRQIMRNCAALGFNTVYWQVRGEGTVTYPSKYEPWTAKYAHRDPGFDPLAVAVTEAHRNGLRIEAWVNVLPGWKGPDPPLIPNQLWNARPEWFLHGADGRKQPLGDFYMILNPAWPDVRRHIVGIVDEIVTNYAVDGVHLDYVRYAWDTTPKARELYPRDQRTIQQYLRQTGKRPDDDPRAWDHWRANQITRLVHEIRDTVDRSRPGATVTAAVWRNPEIGYRDYLQNSIAWLRSGLVDALLPMVYTRDIAQFERDVRMYRAAAPQGRIVPGLGIYLFKDGDPMRTQLERCQRWGGDFALFSYEYIATLPVESVKPPPPEKQRLRGQFRTVLAEYVEPN